MNILNYVKSTVRQGRSLLNCVVIGIIGYFPWTNLLRDINWTYHLFACFQGIMNVVIIYYLICCYKIKIYVFLINPLLLSGLMFLLFALFVPGHVSYTSVSIPLFIVTLNNITLKIVIKTFSIVFLIILIGGYIYSSLGLAGSGVFR